MNERVTLFRKRALEAESNALSAKADETRRAWKIVARDWSLMAEREERRTFNPTPLAPSQNRETDQDGS